MTENNPKRVISIGLDSSSDDLLFFQLSNYHLSLTPGAPILFSASSERAERVAFKKLLNANFL